MHIHFPDMQFAAEWLAGQEADDGLADLGHQAMSFGDKFAMSVLGPDVVEVHLLGGRIIRKERGRGAFDRRQVRGIPGTREADRIIAHSSVRISTVSPISRNRKKGAHAARNGGYPPKLPIASAALSTTK